MNDTTAPPEKAAKGSQLPEPVAERGITKEQWRTLMLSLYPGARSESVLMVWDYCKARKMDPLKKPCHIVPMEVKDQDGNYVWRDVVMPGIYERRVTASGQRAGQIAAVAQLVRRYPGKTGTELAQLGELTERQLSRRLSDADKRGLIQEGERRKCAVTGYSAREWYPA